MTTAAASDSFSSASAASDGLAAHAALHQLWLAVVGMWGQIVHLVQTEPMLRWALLSIAVVFVGSRLRHSVPVLGSMLRFLGNLGLIVTLVVATLGLLVLNGVVLPDPVGRFMAGFGQAEQMVSGKTTHIPLGRDGHFWVRAKVNGVPHRFLIDTGATLTTLSPAAAEDSGITTNPNRPVHLRTANGAAEGRLGSVDELHVGNVIARHLDVVVAPGLGDTNVLGMNFLTRLESWRVEGEVMVLVPHHPAAEEAVSRKGE